jgi:hypothetical protein
MIHIITLVIVYSIKFKKDARHEYKHSIGHTPYVTCLFTEENNLDKLV